MTNYRQLRNPGGEMTLTATGDGIRALRLACQAQAAAATKEASNLRLKAQRTEDGRLSKAMLSAAAMHDETARIQKGLAAELADAHMGKAGTLIGRCLDAKRIAEAGADKAHLDSRLIADGQAQADGFADAADVQRRAKGLAE